MGYDGQSRRHYVLKWSEPPVALGYSFPYVIALLSKTIEIQMIFRQKPHIQTIPLMSPRYITTMSSCTFFFFRFPLHHSLCLTNVLGMYVIALKKHKSVPVYIASKLQIWRLEPIPLNKQVIFSFELLDHKFVSKRLNSIRYCCCVLSLRLKNW